MREERKWIGKDKPSLEATYEDIFEFDIPGYDMWRLIMARDPLCAVNAFWTYVIKAFAPMYGLRVCPMCPRCSTQANPCKNVFGSNATP